MPKRGSSAIQPAGGSKTTFDEDSQITIPIESGPSNSRLPEYMSPEDEDGEDDELPEAFGLSEVKQSEINTAHRKKQ